MDENDPVLKNDPIPERAAVELTIPVPLIGGKSEVIIEGTFPITEANWSHLMAVLAAMKPGLVTPDDPYVREDK